MLKYLLNVIVYLALAVWIGSLVFFGAGVASLIFQPEMLPSRTIAGALNSAILGRLGTIEIVAGVLFLGGALYTAVRYRQWLNWLVLLIAVAMLGTASYYTGTLYPRMDNLRVMIGDFDHMPAEKLPLKNEFDSGHKLYSTLVKGVLFAGVMALVFHTLALVRYADRQSRRSMMFEDQWRAARGKDEVGKMRDESERERRGKKVREGVERVEADV